MYTITINGQLQKTKNNAIKFINADSDQYKSLINTGYVINDNVFTEEPVYDNKYDIYVAGEPEKTKKGNIKTIKSTSKNFEAIANSPNIELKRHIKYVYILHNNEYIKKNDLLREFIIGSPSYEKYMSSKNLIMNTNEEFENAPPITFSSRVIDNFRDHFRSEVYDIQNISSLETFYDFISQQREDNKLTKYAVIKLDTINGPRYVTISPENLYDKNIFVKYIDKLRKGDVAGSDPIEEGNEIDTTYLGITTYGINGFSLKTTSMIANIESDGKYVKSDYLCLFNAVFSQIDYNGECEELKTISDLNTFEEKLMEVFGYSIRCYADWFEDYDDIMIKKNCVYMEISKKKMLLSKINCKSLQLIKAENSKNFVSIVYFNSHYEKYNKYCPIKDGEFYISTKYELLHVINNKIIKKVKRQYIQDELANFGLKKKTGYKTVICKFDFETIYDEMSSGLLRPYTINWEFEGISYQHFGDDCVDVFIDFLYLNRDSRLICLEGYNNSRFDNFFLVNGLIKRDLLTDIFYQKNSILNIKWGGRHVVHDICRFTMSSLDKACNDFNCTYKKIGDFSHSIIQNHYNENKNVKSYFHCADCPIINNNITIDIARSTMSPDELKVLIRNIIKSKGCICDNFVNLVIYNTFDSLATGELYDKINSILQETKAIDGPLFDYKTVGGITYNNFKKATSHLEIPLLNIEKYDRTRSGLFAGRTQCYKGVSYDLSRENKYVMIDVVSLYPYSMLYRKYPCGEVVKKSLKDCLKDNNIGFYLVKVNQEKLAKNVIPRRGETLDWNYKGDMEVFINTVDIKCLIDYGASVEEILCEDNYAFSDTIDGEEMFSCLVSWKKIKQDEDIKKEIVSLKNLRYSTNEIILTIKKKLLVTITEEFVVMTVNFNNVLRNMAKLFLNSLSGKVIENIHLDKTKLVRSDYDMNRLISIAGENNLLMIERKINNGCAIISYKANKEDEFKRQNRPIYLGNLIYSYSRDHMYRSVLANYDVIYQDTDSALMSVNEYNIFIEKNKSIMGTEFGQFSLEEGSFEMDSYVTLSPKNYFIFGGEKLIKKGFKGVNLNKDKFIPNIKIPYIRENIIRHRDNTIEYSYDVSIENAFKLYHDYIPDIKLSSVKESIYEFINQIKTNGCVYVLTSSLIKCIRNNKKHVAGCMYQNYMIKKITTI